MSGEKAEAMSNNSEESWESKTTKVNKYACACVLTASIISAIFGYVTGVMAGALLFIEDDLKINELQVQLLAGVLNACALPGSLVAGRTSDYIGRRYTFILSSTIFLLGSLLMGFGTNYIILMIGRCAAGFAVGFALMIAPVYSAEISPPSCRGFLTAIPDLCINVGILLGYVASYFLQKLPPNLAWRTMVGLPAIPSLALSLLMLRLVESPRWLVMQGRVGDARKVLLLVSNTPQEAEKRLKEIKIAANIDDINSIDQDIVQVPHKTRTGQGALKQLFWKPTPYVRRVLIIAIGLHVFQQMSGIEGILLYSPRIYERAGITQKSKLLLATVGLGISQAIFTCVSTFLLDKVGRRVLLLISAGGSVLSLLGLAICLSIVESDTYNGVVPIWAASFTIVVTYFFVAFNQIGMGPATWVYSCEIFPLRLRAQGLGVSVVVNRTMNVMVVTTFISIYEKITMGGTLFMFTGITMLAWFFYYFFLRETKGRSLEDIEIMYGEDYYKSEIELKPDEKENSNVELSKSVEKENNDVELKPVEKENNDNGVGTSSV